MPHRRRGACIPVIRVVLFWTLAPPVTLVSAWAQQAAVQDTPDTPSAAKTTNRSEHRNSELAFFTMLQRKSIVFPDIATSTRPLSSKEKFELFVNNSISLSEIVDAGFSSAISQGLDSPDGYGQGLDGYGKRFGSSMARNASSNFFGTFLLASLLHQDPRFYPQRSPTFAGSVKYSVERVFVTRNDAGRHTTNWSGLAGPMLAEGLANVYWPEQNRTVGDTFTRYGSDLATTIGGNMLRNYWPVFFKRLRRPPPANTQASPN